MMSINQQDTFIHKLHWIAAGLLVIWVSACSAEIVLLEKPPVVRQITGRILFDGKPITEVTQGKPYFWFRNEDTGKAVDVEVEAKGDAFYFGGLPPGRYGVQVTIDANTQNKVNSPGDYYSWTTFEIEASKRISITVDLRRILHLTSPDNNNSVLSGWAEDGCERGVSFPAGDLLFQWDSLGADVEYEYQIDTVACPYRFIRAAAQGTTGETKFVATLAANPPGEIYILRLNARRAGRPIGILMTWGPNFLAWDYRFQVR